MLRNKAAEETGDGLFFVVQEIRPNFLYDKTLRGDAHGHVWKLLLPGRAQRAKSCCAPLMIEGLGELKSACGLCSSQR